MKLIVLSNLFVLESLFSEESKNILLDTSAERIVINFSNDGFNVGEKYRNMFEKCALNIKEMGMNSNFSSHKFDVEVYVAIDKQTAVIIIPLYTAESVIRNLVSYHKEHEND